MKYDINLTFGKCKMLRSKNNLSRVDLEFLKRLNTIREESNVGTKLYICHEALHAFLNLQRRSRMTLWEERDDKTIELYLTEIKRLGGICKIQVGCWGFKEFIIVWPTIRYQEDIYDEWNCESETFNATDTIPLVSDGPDDLLTKDDLDNVYQILEMDNSDYRRDIYFSAINSTTDGIVFDVVYTTNIPESISEIKRLGGLYFVRDDIEPLKDGKKCIDIQWRHLRGKYIWEKYDIDEAWERIKREPDYHPYDWSDSEDAEYSDDC